MAQGYYNGGGYNNGNYNNGGYYNNQGYRYNRNYNGQYYNNRYYNNNQNQNQNNNNMNNNNNNKDNNNKGHKKGNNAPFYAIIAVLLLVATGCAGFLLIPMGGGNSNVNRTTEEGEKDKPEKEQPKKIVIGDDNFGYLEIPSTYTECGNNADGTTIKYCSKNKKYTVTLKRFQNTNAYSLSRALLNTLKNDGVTDSKVVQITIDGKEAYQIFAVTETDMTVLGLVIDDDLGISHYAGIIGPDGTNGIFGSLEGYKLTN